MAPGVLHQAAGIAEGDRFVAVGIEGVVVGVEGEVHAAAPFAFEMEGSVIHVYGPFVLLHAIYPVGHHPEAASEVADAQLASHARVAHAPTAFQPTVGVHRRVAAGGAAVFVPAAVAAAEGAGAHPLRGVGLHHPAQTAAQQVEVDIPLVVFHQALLHVAVEVCEDDGAVVYGVGAFRHLVGSAVVVAAHVEEGAVAEEDEPMYCGMRLKPFAFELGDVSHDAGSFVAAAVIRHLINLDVVLYRFSVSVVAGSQSQQAAQGGQSRSYLHNLGPRYVSGATVSLDLYRLNQKSQELANQRIVCLVYFV